MNWLHRRNLAKVSGKGLLCFKSRKYGRNKKNGGRLVDGGILTVNLKGGQGIKLRTLSWWPRSYFESILIIFVISWVSLRKHPLRYLTKVTRLSLCICVADPPLPSSSVIFAQGSLLDVASGMEQVLDFLWEVSGEPWGMKSRERLLVVLC